MADIFRFMIFAYKLVSFPQEGGFGLVITILIWICNDKEFFLDSSWRLQKWSHLKAQRSQVAIFTHLSLHI